MLFEEVIDRIRPTWYGRFCFRDVASSINGRIVRIGREVDLYNIRTKQVDLPDNKGPSVKIVTNLLRYCHFRASAVVLLASYLHGECRRSRKKIHAVDLTDLPGCIGAEGVAVGKIYKESYVIAERVTSTVTIFMVA